MFRSRLLGRWILGAAVLAAAAGPAAAQQQPCGVSALCLDGGRYQFTVFWNDFAGNQHAAQAVSLSDESGYFWFFDSTNVEMTAKALDGCAENGHQWIFVSGMTTMPLRVRITDVVTGVQKSYVNDQGSIFESVVDTTTFAGCAGPSEGPVAGSWSGTFTSADFIDCDGPGPVTATFLQYGSSVTGTLDAPGNVCGPRNAQFSGILDGDTLTGTVTLGGYTNGRAFGTLSNSGTQLKLTVINGNGLIPGGILDLHR